MIVKLNFVFMEIKEEEKIRIFVRNVIDSKSTELFKRVLAGGSDLS